ncbi:GNAT family N-acetyltransferase [Aquimarina sp. 2201CG1-2-11]|uniref:GNAT family N-acetyltransferase n=1 Tax=Aquimarina discodermiae TaxID=3231043 RepID=UPI003462D808
MNVAIRKYNPSKDYSQLLQIIISEGDEWKEYLHPKYKIPLEQSITYVAYYKQELCGYSRSINDGDFFIWIMDLLVDKKYRGHGIGKKLMEHHIQEFPNLDVFVLSDVDAYYQKLGYKKEGSLFKVR